MANETTFVKLEVDGTALEWEGTHHSDFEDVVSGNSPCFPVQSVSFSISRPMDPGTRLSGSAMGFPVSVSMIWDKNAPTIAKAVHEGLPVKATFVSATADPGTSKYEITLEIILDGARITDWNAMPGGAGQPIMLTYMISYTSIEIKDSKGGTETKFSHQVAT